MKKLLGVFIVLIFLGCNSESEIPLDLKEVVNKRSYICFDYGYLCGINGGTVEECEQRLAEIIGPRVEDQP